MQFFNAYKGRRSQKSTFSGVGIDLKPSTKLQISITHFSNPAVNGAFTDKAYVETFANDGVSWVSFTIMGVRFQQNCKQNSKNRSGELFLVDRRWECKFTYRWQLKTWDGRPRMVATYCCEDADVSWRGTERSISLIFLKSRISV